MTVKKDLGPKEAKFPVDVTLLTEEDRIALTKEAERSVLEEQKQDARDKYYADQIKRIRQKKIPAERMFDVEINCAPYVPFIMLDGTQFYNGYTYRVPQGVAAVLREQCQRSWNHQDEVDGRRRFSAYRRPQETVIGARHAGVPTRGFDNNAIINAVVGSEGNQSV
jgi:hypothetical protein